MSTIMVHSKFLYNSLNQFRTTYHNLLSKCNMHINHNNNMQNNLNISPQQFSSNICIQSRTTCSSSIHKFICISAKATFTTSNTTTMYATTGTTATSKISATSVPATTSIPGTSARTNTCISTATSTSTTPTATNILRAHIPQQQQQMDRQQQSHTPANVPDVPIQPQLPVPNPQQPHPPPQNIKA
ncbi:anaphase-promoting complex subunit cdh1-like [Ostrea edulis]|uniref:anaphase-promoting complex subunit cdh1-like n=1 Tax=Ostrea edulis TaxID=37623 RepID=UPI0024AF1B50|nr:anaphase-promoting complex subunit cdh1-like [Ostrea edulis]